MKEIKDTVFSTPWFAVERVSYPDVPEIGNDPYYRITSPDGVILLATTTERKIVLVRQFRPALGRYTIELPAGAIDDNETAEAAASRELTEETGYRCKSLRSLGAGHIMLNRHRSLLHAYYAEGVECDTPSSNALAVTLSDFKSFVLSGEFEQMTALSLFTLAAWRFGLVLWANDSREGT
jgi:ADP-ribose pyrophosphatase